MSGRENNQHEEKTWREVIVEDLEKLVPIETWRPGTNEARVQENLTAINRHFTERMEKFNKDSTHQISAFEWQSKDDKYRVFRFRAGNGQRKVSIICHLDTVPPGNDDWGPFDPRVETRIYKGVQTDFLIGRGAIDDKGPAVVAFEAFTRALKNANGNEDALKGVTLEVLFDTSEETDMSTPHYFEANKDEMPAFGIVFDAIWSVRAEKGIERPTFTINSNDVPAAPDNVLSIADLKTSPGSTNMIPVTAEAHIKGKKDDLDRFAANVNGWYRSCPFDDPEYEPAEIAVTESGPKVIITAKVAGAQHGSAPQENRAHGANPVVSLANFLASLLERGILANNYNGEMCRFIRWAFGTRAFGENHPDLLERYDSIFGEGNGTTYALTQLLQGEDDRSKEPIITLGIDIRYAVGHHGMGWDGKEGTIKGDSIFNPVFDALVKRYRSESGGVNITFDTETIFGPDIRSPRDENLFRINMAYRSIMGDNCPMLAIGGATDAHGYLNLVTAGSLFTESLGPPVNYHGIDEGAPLIDLENSGKILLHLLLQELNIPEEKQSYHEQIHQCHGCCI